MSGWYNGDAVFFNSQMLEVIFKIYLEISAPKGLVRANHFACRAVSVDRPITHWPNVVCWNAVLIFLGTEQRSDFTAFRPLTVSHYHFSSSLSSFIKHTSTDTAEFSCLFSCRLTNAAGSLSHINVVLCFASCLLIYIKFWIERSVQITGRHFTIFLVFLLQLGVQCSFPMTLLFLLLHYPFPFVPHH